MRTLAYPALLCTERPSRLLASPSTAGALRIVSRSLEASGVLDLSVAKAAVAADTAAQAAEATEAAADTAEVTSPRRWKDVSFTYVHLQCAVIGYLFLEDLGT